MAKVVYKSYNRNEGSLFPVYLSDMVPAEHPARVVDAVVDGLFTQVVELLVEEGLLTLDVQYIDGTKIESSANKYTFVWKLARFR